MSELINAGLPFVGSEATESRVSRRPNFVSHGGQPSAFDRVFAGVYVDKRAARLPELFGRWPFTSFRPAGAVFYGATVAFLLGVDTFPPKQRFNFVPQCVVPHHRARCTRKQSCDAARAICLTRTSWNSTDLW